MEPAAIVLVHGAASGPWVFDGWEETFPNSHLIAVDLQVDRDVASASMNDYAAAVTEAAGPAPRPLALCGWSMGGLVALMAAEAVRPDWLVLLEPSPPVEVRPGDPAVVLEPGTYEGESVYGSFPQGVPSRPDSMMARSQRRRGVSVPSVAGPVLVVYGADFPDERGRAVAAFFGADQIGLDDLDHWDLVLDRRARGAVARWLSGTPPAGGVERP